MDLGVIARMLDVDVDGEIRNLRVRLRAYIAVFDLDYKSVLTNKGNIAWRTGLDCVFCTGGYLFSGDVAIETWTLLERKGPCKSGAEVFEVA